MRKRDWGASMATACLIALAGFLRGHTIPVVLLSLGAAAGVAVVLWDVWGPHRSPRAERALPRGNHPAPAPSGLRQRRKGIDYLLRRSVDTVNEGIDAADASGQYLKPAEDEETARRDAGSDRQD